MRMIVHHSGWASVGWREDEPTPNEVIAALDYFAGRTGVNDGQAEEDQT